MTQRSPPWGRSQEQDAHLHLEGWVHGPGGDLHDDRATKTCGERSDYELAIERGRYCVAIETWQQQYRGHSNDEWCNIYRKRRFNQEKEKPHQKCS